jgi:hypothetical protein
MRCALAILGVACVAEPALAEEKGAPMAPLEFLVGAWEGRSTFHFPRDPDRTPFEETGRMSCDYILKRTYILCESEWTRADGKTRGMRIHFNRGEKLLRSLYIYDNWLGAISMDISVDSAPNTLLSFIDYEGPGGAPGKEKIVWTVSTAGGQVHGEEFNRLLSEPEDGWKLNFDFVWTKVSAN